MDIKTAIRPKPSAPYKFPEEAGYLRIDVSFVSQNKVGGQWMRDLAPDNLAVTDFEGNRCENLWNFMEFIKVYPFRGHLDGDEPSVFWKTWKLRGFKLKHSIKNDNSHSFSYDGVKMDYLDEEEYFIKKYKAAVRKTAAFQELKKITQGNKILLVDMDLRVPEALKELLYETI
jgi:hypothetical protein